MQRHTRSPREKKEEEFFKGVYKENPSVKALDC
jgi:hypothetical protein